MRLAADGREALQRIREERPGLIVLDVMMPEMNGFDVAAVLKNDPATMDIPMIILSELMASAVAAKPDIIILNSLLSGQQEAVRSLRFEKGLDNVLFLIYQA